MRTSVLAILMAMLTISSAVAETVATVEQGHLSGRREEGLSVFRGIPFAAPPVASLRWRAPLKAAKWSGVRRADKFAPQCFQGAFGPPIEQAPTSEDCLYLNVWSPAGSKGERLPVLVWIYGGGFNGGATSSPLYSGEALAKKGVVVVSIAYRVGPLGFLAHPALSAESRQHASGNYGLQDMIAGLKWVRSNFAAFGGDPNKVTIFGESAGGIAVSMLCASPQAKALFDAAISESGGSFGPSRPAGAPGENMRLLADAERNGVALARSAGAKSIAEMRKLPPEKIIDAGRSQGLAWPNIDGWIIPSDQYALYSAKKFNDVPVLIGYNSDEGQTFGAPQSPQAYIAGVKRRYGRFADSLLKAYPSGETTVPKTARDLTRDAAFGWQNWTWARLQSQSGSSKVYYYYFDQNPDNPAGIRAEHGREMFYVFGHLDQLPHERTTPTDQAISDAMITYWTNFAKFGDPNGASVPQWPSFSNRNPAVMLFNETPHVGAVASVEGLKALDAYFAWRRSPEGASASIIEDASSAPTNVAGASYPKVLPDHRAAFQIKAPEAREVDVDIMGNKYPMARDPDGVWTVATPPLVEGFHYYALDVDGVRVNDPASHAFFGTGIDISSIEIPEDGVDTYP